MKKMGFEEWSRRRVDRVKSNGKRNYALNRAKVEKLKGLVVKERKWKFQSREDEGWIVTSLWLYPELDISSCVGDLEDEDPQENLDYYVTILRRRYPEMWKADAVSISWSVRAGNGHIAEYAPVSWEKENFLTFFTAPVDAVTGEPLNWWKLPVRNTRFPSLAKGLGWMPAPFMRFAPIRSIVQNATA